MKVGTITKIDPHDGGVRVSMKVDSGQPIPAEAKAAIVSPQLVSGRFVQLSPAYTGGARLDDGATIAQERTAVPLSFDDVKQQLIDLSTTPGPRAATSSPLRGDHHRARREPAGRQRRPAAARRSPGSARRPAALSDGRSDLFETVSNLDSFTRNLAVNDAAVGGFTRELGSVGTVLSNNRRQLTEAVRAPRPGARDDPGVLHGATGPGSGRSVADLNLLAAALADRSNELAGVLHIAPTALIDLHNIVENQAITGRASLTGLDRRRPADLWLDPRRRRHRGAVPAGAGAAAAAAQPARRHPARPDGADEQGSQAVHQGGRR